MRFMRARSRIAFFKSWTASSSSGTLTDPRKKFEGSMPYCDASELEAARATLAQVKRLHELNPMLGTRGCRLAMLYPEIPAMQTRAIIRAALAVLEREGETIGVEIMIPLVALSKELEIQREIVEKTVAEELKAAGKELPPPAACAALARMRAAARAIRASRTAARARMRAAARRSWPPSAGTCPAGCS